MNDLDLQIHNQPHSAEAEEKLIASCLLPGDTSIYDMVRPLLEPEDFYLLRFRLLYQTIGDLAQLSQPIDEVSISEHLKTLQGLDEVGGIAGILSVTDSVTSTTSAKFYANIVAEKARLREIMKSCRLAVEEVENETKSYDEIRSTLEA